MLLIHILTTHNEKKNHRNGMVRYFELKVIHSFVKKICE